MRFRCATRNGWTAWSAPYTPGSSGSERNWGLRTERSRSATCAAQICEFMAEPGYREVLRKLEVGKKTED